MTIPDESQEPTATPMGARPDKSDAPAPADPTLPEDEDELREEIIGVLKACYDPEIPVNIYELGLIYDIGITPPGDVHIKMTLTSPACPVAGSLPPEVEMKVASVPGVTNAHVDVIWDPPWNMTMMSEAAKLQLNLM
ncbi:MAG: iron-sulfur cluster assembly protein [Candidatus Sumerlaeaceae bacterium]|nr:iron-sulfur cluster assembly protein [Candidatus Sumerlaeaceae bacterium]